MAQVRVAAQGRKVRAAQVRAVVRVWPVAAPVRVAQRLLCEDGPCEVCKVVRRSDVSVRLVRRFLSFLPFCQEQEDSGETDCRN